MIERRLRALRITVLAALGVSAAGGCGGATSGPPGHSQGGAGYGGAATAFGGSGSGGDEAVSGTGQGGASSGGTGGHASGGVGNVSSGGGANGLSCVPASRQNPGSVLCTNGWTHRERSVSCQVVRPPTLPAGGGGAGGAGGSGGEAGWGCTSDSDCRARPYGLCVSAGPDSECVYGCAQDSDCSAGSICFCSRGSSGSSATVGTCLMATCSTDADCGDGLCAADLWKDPCSGLPFGAFRCRSELPPVVHSGAVCGRPFLVQGVARTASLQCGDASSTSELAAAHIESSEARRALAQHWAQLALMEHASVAAFARFMLELMALGAPAHLLEATQRALGDELEHARLCFELASRYAGQSLSPAALSLTGALTSEPSPTDIVCCAFREACIGETVAVAEAEAALALARDPAVVVALTRIAADEARHAELGYRFVGWALERLAAPERARLIEQLSELLETELSELAAIEAQSPVSVPRELNDHGMLSSAQRLRARRQALIEVVLPCASALGIRRLVRDRQGAWSSQTSWVPEASVGSLGALQAG